MKRKINPFDKFILVKKIEVKDKTAGGIYVPKNKEEIREGIIVEVGKNVDTELKKGYLIGWKEYSGQPVDEFVIVDQEEVLYYVINSKNS